MANLALGIDTGGTYTDGVIFDLEGKNIVAKTKQITTRHDLAIAVDNCMENLLNGETNIDIDDIRMVSLSTTLATNAIVEGQGAEVGLIMIGFKPEQKLPTPHQIHIDGGCNIKGKVKKEVDLKTAEAEILSIKDQVDAFAISGYFSIRNPVQEKKVEELVRNLTGYPVVSAHQLSSDLGIHERTVTAVFNARLMPLITELIDTVKKQMTDREIKAPLMVVKGDGSLISESMAREKPVETSLSGPAASIVGAMALTGKKNALVVDMGGTTTDVAILEDGRPNLTEKGAEVGGWLTRVRAAEITTEGIGGDSLVQVSKNGELSVGPQRVFPLSWAAKKYPHLLSELETIKKANYFPLSFQPTSILVYIKDPVNFDPSDTEKEILKMIKEKPHSLYYISRQLDRDADILPWKHLVNVGSVHRASLTPTDLLHYNNKFNKWEDKAASLGIEIMAFRSGQDPDQFVANALEKIYNKIALLLIRVLLNHDLNENLTLDTPEVQTLMNKMLATHSKQELIKLMARVKMPLIAVGAPVRAYFKQVAEKVQADLLLPEAAEVANAAGTVSGKVIERVDIIIKPGQEGGFLVHSPEGRKSFIEFDDAVDYGRKTGMKYVRERASLSGGTDIEVVVDQNDRYSRLPGQVEGDKNRLFIESIIKVSAVGKPW